MSSTNIVDLCSDDELGETDMKAFKLELVLDRAPMQQKEYQKANLTRHPKSNTNSKRQESEENRSLNCSSTRQSNPSILDQQLSPIDDASLSFASPICSAPVCRQFWKAGNYDEGLASKSTLQSNVLSRIYFDLWWTFTWCHSNLVFGLHYHVILVLKQLKWAHRRAKSSGLTHHHVLVVDNIQAWACQRVFAALSGLFLHGPLWPRLLFFWLQMEVVIYIFTRSSFIQMRHHINGHLEVCPGYIIYLVPIQPSMTCQSWHLKYFSFFANCNYGSL